MKTVCSECEAETVILGVNLIIPAENVYQVVFGCTACGTKTETSRVLEINEIAKFNPQDMAQPMSDGPVPDENDTLVKF